MWVAVLRFRASIGIVESAHRHYCPEIAEVDPDRSSSAWEGGWSITRFCTPIHSVNVVSSKYLAIHQRKVTYQWHRVKTFMLNHVLWD